MGANELITVGLVSIYPTSRGWSGRTRPVSNLYRFRRCYYVVRKKNRPVLVSSSSRTAQTNQELLLSFLLHTQPHGSRTGLSIGGAGVCGILFVLSAYAALEFDFPLQTQGTFLCIGMQWNFRLVFVTLTPLIFL